MENCMLPVFSGSMKTRFACIREMIKTLGLVFGDIGTSPTYTLTIVFLLTPVTIPNILGIVSLVCWTLILLVLLEYSTLAMSLSKKGEGGTIVLKEILVPLLKSTKHVTIVSLLAYIGLSLLIGDGVLTPVMNILAAVEGIRLIPFFTTMPRTYLLILASTLAILLFVLQKRGTDKISIAFGPIMLVWFIILGTTGISNILQFKGIVQALNPFHAFNFIINNGIASFFVLSDVILCATGSEALYADMGHIGRKPIQRTAYIVLAILLASYLGQGAYLALHPNNHVVFYEMMYKSLGWLYAPFLCLNFCASVIASQAMISGIFSIVYQSITTRILPKFKVEYTSSKFRSQIYIGLVNWSLLSAVICLFFFFRESNKLAVAYGFAVTGTMTVTGILMTLVFYLRKHYAKAALSSIITLIDIAFFLSSLCKIPRGGYISILLGLIPLSIILIYTAGQKKVNQALKPNPLNDFLEKYIAAYESATHIKGTALFFTRDVNAITPYIPQTIFKNNIIYEDNIIVTLITRDDPFGVIGFFKGDLATGLRFFEIHMGYMEIIDIEKILRNAGINAKVIFYGLEEIVTKNPIWRIYALIKHITPSFVQFYKLPPYKLHGVVTIIEL